MEKIRIAIVGVGNCASSLLQGIEYYRHKKPEDAIGLMHWDIGGYTPSDIEVVAAFDIDKRKVGLDVNKAIFAKPNCTAVFCSSMPATDVKVRMGKVLDGYSDHMKEYEDDYVFKIAKSREPSLREVAGILKKTGTEILMNYLPVGSEQATAFYAEACLKAGVALVNNIPVFIASNPQWAARFEKAGLPVIGDDIKAQLGATITHRTLVDLFKKRGVKLERTYQLNTGGNTDFLNMLNRARLKSKKESKTEAVQSVAATRLDNRDIHVGPSDYVPWQNDQKICFIRMEGKLFGDVPMNLELRLSVEDSPNSAGVAIDSIRCAKLALKAGVSGVLYGPSSYFCKHPARQFPDSECYRQTEEFIKKYSPGSPAAKKSKR
jgi:myo-inositol-1-phosphate synthase